MSSSAPSSDVTSSNAAASHAEGAPPAPTAGPAGEPGEEAGIWPALRKTLRHFFPNFVSWLASTPDPRDPRFTVYPIAYVLMSGLLVFLTKLGSRRQMRFQFGTPQFIANVNSFVGTSCEGMLHPDTLAYLAKRLPLGGLESLRHAMLNELLRKKVFEKHRLLGKYYLVAIDGTGFLVYRERHCEHCLTRDHGGTVVYYHPVLEAKLVSRSGLCLSIATEFIENPDAGVDKQDCERKAFLRLSERLKRDFPQLSICVLLDSLYITRPVFDRCGEYGWRFLVTFKEGSAQAVFEEYERLRAAGAKEHAGSRGDVSQQYWWVNGVDFGGKPINVLECRERDPQGRALRFVWATDISVNEANFAELGNHGGRLRWKIENEGFNVQKNNGYEMEHAYSEHEHAAKNFYLLLQIAHLIAQLLEKGLLAKSMAKKIGAIRNVARFLLEELRRLTWDPRELDGLLAERIQIRLADSS